MRLLLITSAALVLNSCSEFTTSGDSSFPTSASDEKGYTGVPSSGTYPIDLETTLKLAAGRNLDLAIEKSNRAAALSDRAVLSLVPDLAVGASFAKQNGLLQDTIGTPVNTTRVNDSAGLGTSSGVPGVSLDLPLGRAIFAPLATRQDRKAAIAAAQAKEHQVFADAAAYYELVRARSSLQLAREIEGAAGKLADSTKSSAAAGEGLDADAERAIATQFLRKGNTASVEANLLRRSAALARILHLPPSLTLVPTDISIAATDLVDPDEPIARMVATALRFRPVTAQMQAEVAAAGNRLTEQKNQTLPSEHRRRLFELQFWRRPGQLHQPNRKQRGSYRHDLLETRRTRFRQRRRRPRETSRAQAHPPAGSAHPRRHRQRSRRCPRRGPSPTRPHSARCPGRQPREKSLRTHHRPPSGSARPAHRSPRLHPNPRRSQTSRGRCRARLQHRSASAVSRPRPPALVVVKVTSAPRTTDDRGDPVVGVGGFSAAAMPTVFLGLWITGTELNITAIMGMTMIVGIVGEVAIFYISEVRELETDPGSKELDYNARLALAGKNRMRPIAMTTFAAILALMPLALGIGQGSALQQPLAIAIVSGLIAQLPITLIVLPALLRLLRCGSSAPAT